MSLLLPELERQLRDAVHAEMAAARDPEPKGGVARGRPRLSLGTLVATGAALVALIVGAVVVTQIRHRSPVRSTSPASRSSYPIDRPDCRYPATPPVPEWTVLARGSVAGRSWAFEEDTGYRGALAVQAGRFVLGRRAYGLCSSVAQFHLIDTTPHGIVYGFVFTDQVQYAAEITGPRDVPFPMQRHLPGGLLFVEALPEPGCDYGALTLTAGPTGPYPVPPGGHQESLRLGACRPGALRPESKLRPGRAVSIRPPHRLPRSEVAEFTAGEVVVGESGCLACHTIGSAGSNGPGPPLTRVGSVLRSTSIRAALLHPAAPMPSFRGLPKQKLRALVFFLSQLRG